MPRSDPAVERACLSEHCVPRATLLAGLEDGMLRGQGETDAAAGCTKNHQPKPGGKEPKRRPKARGAVQKKHGWRHAVGCDGS
jgi:hypothetical protein